MFNETFPHARMCALAYPSFLNLFMPCILERLITVVHDCDERIEHDQDEEEDEPPEQDIRYFTFSRI